MSEFRRKLRTSLNQSFAEALDRGTNDIDTIIDNFRIRIDPILQSISEKSPEKAVQFSKDFEDTIAEFRQDNLIDSELHKPELNAESAPTTQLDAPAPVPVASEKTGILVNFSTRSFVAGAIFGVLSVIGINLALGLDWPIEYFSPSPKVSLFELTAETSIIRGKDNTIQRLPGETAFLVYSTAKAPSNGGSTGGISISLSPEIEERASGQKIRVTVDAAPLTNRTSPEFAVVYSTAAVGNSSWQKFKPGAESGSWSFEYDVPKRQEKPGLDYIGIWADTSGSGGGIKVEDIRIEVMEPS